MKAMRRNLSTRPLTDHTSGATLTGTAAAYEHTSYVGSGDPCWTYATTELVRWGIKTRSGFSVEGDPKVVEGRRYWLTAHLGPFRLREPVQVVAVVDEPTRKGFAYTTLSGHPVRGEETFLLDRHPDDTIWLTIRSVTHPAPGFWRLAYPAALLAQRIYRRRYFTALAVG